MDLTLARTLQLKMQEEGRQLQQWQFFDLAHSCRKAKEQLLQDAELESVSVVVPGRGSRLVGGTISCELTRQELEEALLRRIFFNMWSGRPANPEYSAHRITHTWIELRPRFPNPQGT